MYETPWLAEDSPRHVERFKAEVKHLYGYFVQYAETKAEIRSKIRPLMWLVVDDDEDARHDVTIICSDAAVGTPLYAPDLDLVLTIIDRDEVQPDDKNTQGATGHSHARYGNGDSGADDDDIKPKLKFGGTKL